MGRVSIQVQDTRGNWLTVQFFKPHNIQHVSNVMTKVQTMQPGRKVRAFDPVTRMYLDPLPSHNTAQ